jgi:hypothetical protein
MDYRYTNEDKFTAAIEITLEELNTTLRILEPISTDATHNDHVSARNLYRKFAAIRKETLKIAVQGLSLQLESLKE